MLSKSQLGKFVLVAQGLGAVFFATFWAAYAFALPSNEVLSGEPFFRITMSVFGGLFLLTTAILLILSISRKK